MSTEELYGKLSASELSAIILKGSSPSNDRDVGFYSGSSEGGDDLSIDHSRLEPHSPTDASEDSVEVKVTPISLIRNKRKSTEPSRVICEQETGPLKKRIRFTSTNDKKDLETINETKNHFRPWDQNLQLSNEGMPNPAEVLIRHPGVTTLHRALVSDVQEEPLALIAKKPATTTTAIASVPQNNSRTENIPDDLYLKTNERKKESCNDNNDADDDDDEIVNCNNESSFLTTVPVTNNNNNNNNNNLSSSSSSTSSQRPQQRNYKNMTRERRIEANARERTRVHTISAAYDTLRRAIPSYSHTQKLSKLSVLRVACSYILTLSRMAGHDYSEDQSSPSLSQCIDLITKTIQTEGKIRKKKDE